MLKELIHAAEHSRNFSLSEEQLVCLLKENNKLIKSIDLSERYFQTGYYIGLSWIVQKQKALYVVPKLNTEFEKIDYLKMLSICFSHPEILKHGDDLFEIQFDQPAIKLKQQEDLLTPLLIVYFLRLVHAIVKKGLKKGYYKIESNLYATIKGKVLVGNTLKQNTFKNRTLNTVCSHEEFGINNTENRIIKKALLFILRYLKMNQTSDKGLTPILNYILPAFENVNENISINEVKKARHNPFFSEYSKGVDISLIILKRFGFNLNFIKQNEEIDVPPFWINMAKLYEMFVLGKLKQALGRNEIIFQSGANYGELDFLRTTKNKEMVIDAKYKPQYKTIPYEIEDIRQLSGYARDIGTLRKLQIGKENWNKAVLDCLIIYPDQDANSDVDPNELFKTSITQFEKFYKIGISIPVIKDVQKIK